MKYEFWLYEQSLKAPHVWLEKQWVGLELFSQTVYTVYADIESERIISVRDFNKKLQNNRRVDKTEAVLFYRLLFKLKGCKSNTTQHSPLH